MSNYLTVAKLSKKLQTKLKYDRVKVTKKMHIDERFLDYLCQYESVTDPFRKLLQEHTEHLRGYKLLDYLPTRSSKSLVLFALALIQTDQEHLLTEELRFTYDEVKYIKAYEEVWKKDILKQSHPDTVTAIKSDRLDIMRGQLYKDVQQYKDLLKRQHAEEMREASSFVKEVDAIINPKKDNTQIGEAVKEEASHQSKAHGTDENSATNQTPGTDQNTAPNQTPKFMSSDELGSKCRDRINQVRDTKDRLESEQMRDFDFEGWFKQYMGWMGNNESRIMDDLCKQDDDDDGKVTRDQFIKGIMSSKFVTSCYEMETVTDFFDRAEDGLIDYKKVVKALKTDQTEIQDAVTKETSNCRCDPVFRVVKIGMYQYGFGGSIHMVRILDTAIMVRVGGGWVDLHEFLKKRDPCRASGRAAGVSESLKGRPESKSKGKKERSPSLADIRSIPAIQRVKKPEKKTYEKSRLQRASSVYNIKDATQHAYPTMSRATSRSSLSSGHGSMISEVEKPEKKQYVKQWLQRTNSVHNIKDATQHADPTLRRASHHSSSLS